MLGEVFGLRIGEDRSSRTADARQNAHKGADQRGTDQVDPLPLEVGERELLGRRGAVIHLLDLKPHPLFRLFEDLGDREQADQDREQLEPVLHLAPHEVGDHPVSVVDAEHPHQADENTEEARKDAAQHLPFGERRNNGECKEDDEEFFN